MVSTKTHNPRFTVADSTGPTGERDCRAHCVCGWESDSFGSVSASSKAFDKHVSA